MGMEAGGHEVYRQRDATLPGCERHAPDIGRALDHAFGQTEAIGKVLEVGRRHHHDAERHAGKRHLHRDLCRDYALVPSH